MKKISSCLWFDDNAEQAVKFYTSVFEKSAILRTARYTKSGPGQPGSVMTIQFRLLDQEFVALNGGPVFKFTEAVSFVVKCETQQEVDYYWKKLSAGGRKVQCGWLRDKFGLSWQIVPAVLYRLAADTDPAKVERVMGAMLKMVKLDIKGLRSAYAGK